MFRVVAILSAVLLSAGVVHAHGGVPQSQAVLFDPDDADHMMVVATFGLLETTDGGATWQWICVQSIPSGRLGFTNPTVLGPGAALFLAQRDALRRSDTRGCGWSAIPAALDGSFVADVSIDPSTGAVLALQSDVAVDNHVYRSSDGLTFTPTAGGIPAPFLPERVRTAPSDPDRIYVSAEAPPMVGTSAMPAVYTSDDGGATFAAHPFSYEADELELNLLAVHPTDPDTVYAWVKGELTDRLIISEDAGASFRTIDTLAAAPVPNGRPFGFARAPDGTLFYGNSEQGLLRSPDGTMLDLLNRNLDVACLEIRDDVLYVCGNGLAGADGFSLGTAPLSDPTALTPLLTFDRVTGPSTCAPPSDVTATCTEWFDDLLRDFGRAAPDAGRADAAVDGGADGGGGADAAAVDSGAPDAASTDAGAEPPPDGSSDGCGCGVAAPPSQGPAYAAFLIIVAAYWRHGRSRRR